MGSFNSVCQVSNMIITTGQKAVNIVIAKNRHNRKAHDVVNISDDYYAISLPFISRYDDYGRFELDDAHERHNHVAWKLLVTYLSDSSHRVPAEWKGFVSTVLECEDMDAFYTTFMEAISNVKSADLSFMTLDYEVYAALIRQEKNKLFTYGAIETREEGIRTYIETDLLPRSERVFDRLGSVSAYVALKKQDVRTEKEEQEMKYLESEENLNMVEVFNVLNAFQDEANRGVRLHTVVGFPDMFSLFHFQFYFYLLETVKKDRDDLGIFTDAYALRCALMALHLPYGCSRVGSQDANYQSVVTSIMGTVAALRQGFIREAEYDYSFLRAHLDKPDAFWDDVSEEEIVALIQALPMEDILAICKAY